MKKITALLITFLMLVLCLTSCGIIKDENEKVKVLADYELTAESYAFAVAKGNSEIKDAANELLAELKESGELENIINSFFNGKSKFVYENPVSSLPKGDSKNQYLVVATNAFFPPFEYHEGNKLTGVDMQIAYLLAEKLDKTLYIHDIDFDSVIVSVSSGESDIGMAGMTVNEKRLETVDFTTEYYESKQVIIVRENDTVFADCKSGEDVIAKLKEQNSGFNVGAQMGTTGFMFVSGDEGFGYEGFENLSTKGYKTGALAVLDLKNKNLDAVILDNQPAIMIAKTINNPYNGIKSFWEEIKEGAYKSILIGIRNTVIIAVFGLLIGIVLGSFLAVIKLVPKNNKLMDVLSRGADVYIALFRGLPMMVQLLLTHYVILPLFDVHILIEIEAIIVFGFNSAAYVCEIMRGGILSVDPGQTEAGRALGLSYPKTMLKIVLPQAVKNVTPTLGNEFITLLKETSILYFIGVKDIYTSIWATAQSTLEFMVPSIALASVYLVLILAVTGLVKLLERRLRASDKR